MKFPKTVYVRRETERSGESYLLASEEADGGHDEKVAVYRLVAVKTMKITEKLV